MSVNPVILEDTFTVNGVNTEGTVYLRVSRIRCVNQDGSLTITADINSEEFPVATNDRLTIVLANSLELGGKTGSKHYDHSVYHRETRLNDCDYAMHGRVYGHEVVENGLEVNVHISCGGLLTNIVGKPQGLRDVHYNSDVYILIKRVKD
jgi:DNA-directed RNA polymerases I, II, and III subunit RPABC3